MRLLKNRSPWAVFMLGLGFLAAFTAGIVAQAADAAAPRNLRCEYQAEPLGLDTPAPRFSWELDGPGRGVAQTAWQMRVGTVRDGVATDPKVVWDSGKVESDQSVLVTYGGPALESRGRYYWTVRIWNAQGQPSPYAEPAAFEMGLLGPADWRAKWVGMPEEQQAALPLGDWIWHPAQRGDKEHAFFRKTFEVRADSPVVRAQVRATADDRVTLYLNGRDLFRHGGSKTFGELDVTSLLQPGRNVLAADAMNATAECGLLCGMEITYADDRCEAVVSDATWLSADKPAKGWAEPNHDDAAWEKAVVVAKYGAEPWGRVDEKSVSRSQWARTAFRCDKPVARARAYVSGLGLYELRLNGRRVSEDVFAPGWTQYPKRIQYQTYDVTALIREGENVAAAVLGNGWWGEGMAGAWKDGPLRFLLQLEIEDTAGGRTVVVTDGSFRAHPSAITFDSFYNGETYDARLEQPGWDAPGFDASGWAPVQVLDEPMDRLVAQEGPPLRVTEELAPAAVTEPAPGVFVYDFGQNASGRARLKVHGSKGTRVLLRFAEVLLPDGHIYTENYRSALAADTYILKGEGEEVWEPTFTYRGFRYAELTGYPGKPGRDALTARVLHSAPPMNGAFECSHPLVNRIQHNILWGQRSNLHSVPTDCPQRDERLGWTGDAQAFCATSCWNMEMAGFYHKWLRDIRDSRHEDGSVTDVAPCLGWGPASPAWGDAVVIVPWQVYQFYGDTRIIEDNFEAMTGWVDYMRGQANEGLWEREGYGDWVAPVESPKKPIAAAYQYYSTALLARMADAIGKKDAAADLDQRAREIRARFNERYLDTAANAYLGGTQTANLLPLFFGLAPEDRAGAIAANVVGDIAARDGHLSTGFLGTAYLMPVLSRSGHHDTAWRLATQTTYPSWGFTIENGATTIWERWNSCNVAEVGPGMNSFNHFAFGSVGQWFYEDLAGINAAAPGFKRIRIQPRPAAGLDWVKAAYRTPYGRVRSEWRRDGNALRMTVEVPANTRAAIHVPAERPDAVLEGGGPAQQADGVAFKQVEDGAAVFETGSGVYEFVVPAYAGP